jgi:transposase
VLLSAQGMSAVAISEVVFTDPDTVREVIHNFNRDGFDALYPRYRGGRPRQFTLPERRQIKQIALAVPTDLGAPFATWSLAKLADYLVAEGVVTDISHEGLRSLLHEEGVRFQALRTWKRSNDPDFEAKKNRILALYAIADGTTEPEPGDPTVILCMDEFGPLNLQPHPGKQWAPIAKGKGDVATPRRRRRRATYTRPHGVRHLMAGYDLCTDRLYGHVVKKKGRTAFLTFARYLRSLYPPEVRIAIVLDNFIPHLSTKHDQRVAEWAAVNNVELAYTPTYSSWLNRIEAQFQALRYFALDGTDHQSHAEQASMIRRYIIWRNRHALDDELREIVNRANVA